MAFTIDTRESANYARIACLVIREGTARIRHKTINNLPPNQAFKQTLALKEPKLKSLRNKGILSSRQYDILYPSMERIHISNIDMTLWLILIRNITAGSVSKRIKWSESPKETEKLWQHDVIRIREIRNKLFHTQSPELDDIEYNSMKEELIAVLQRLGSPNEVVSNHLTRELDPDQMKICTLQVREQCLDEIFQMSVVGMRHKKQMRIIVAVLFLLAALVAVSIAVPVVIYFKKAPPCERALKWVSHGKHWHIGGVQFMSRHGWGALPRRNKSMAMLHKPVQKAVLFNTEFVRHCDVTTDCCHTVRRLQEYAFDSPSGYPYDDMPYNFLIGNDGVVYEGRGARYVGEAIFELDTEVISIAFLGNFLCEPPSRAAMTALYIFLDYIQYEDPTTDPTPGPILHHNYTLYPHCHVNVVTPGHNLTFPNDPGAALINEIAHWTHFSKGNMSESHCNMKVDCLRPVPCCRVCNNTDRQDL